MFSTTATPFYSWDPSFVYGQPKCLVCENNPIVPVVRTLDGHGFISGSRLVILGTVRDFSEGFSIELINGTTEQNALQFSTVPMRFYASFTRNEVFLSRKRSNYWDKNPFSPDSLFPFVHDEEFKLEFVNKSNLIEIRVNGKFFTVFQIDVNDNIRHLKVSGHVKIAHLRVENPVTVLADEKQLRTLNFGPNSTLCRFIRSDEKVSFFWPGSKIIINTILEENAKRLQITFQKGSVEQKSDSIPLQIKVNILASVAILRSKSSQSDWLRTQQINLTNHKQLLKLKSLEVIIECQINYFNVALNGMHVCAFDHVVDFTEADHVIITGDCSVQLVRRS